MPVAEKKKKTNPAADGKAVDGGQAPELSPVQRQYHQFKAQYPDYVLLFRMGDFYEAFWDDAKALSAVTGVTLTTRGGVPDAIPMAGVPYHAIETYLKKLIAAGHKAALCEQVDPAGDRPREVTRVVMPGTLVEDVPVAPALVEAAEPVAAVAPPAAAPEEPFAAVFSRGELLAALQSLDAVAKIRSPKPVLACCLLRAEGGKVVAEATDLERSLRVLLTQTQVEASGAAAVPCKELLAVVGELDADTLRIECRSGRAKIVAKAMTEKAGKKKEEEETVIHKPCRPAAEWPPIPADISDDSGRVAGADLLRALGRAATATEREASDWRAGVLLEMRGSVLRAVGTDGRRIALAECPYAGPAMPNTVIPVSAVAALAKAVDPECPVLIRLEESAALFGGEDGSWAFRTVVLAAQFPKYADAYPAMDSADDAPSERRLTANREALLSAVRRAQLGLDEHQTGAAMLLGPSGLRLESRRDDGSTASVPLPCEYRGAPLTIGTNAGFLRQGLEATDAADVTLDFTDARLPMLLRGIGDGSFRYLLMPVDLKGTATEGKP